MELWRTFRRRTYLTAVVDANGSPCTTLEQSANVLIEYWGSVFSPATEDRSRWAELLRHVQMVPRGPRGFLEG
eukprot:2385758-Pyramimonas_sp.AAC.1